MQYRSFGSLHWKPSALGFGAMRLPLLGDGSDPSQIDTDEAVHIMRVAFDAGVNYVDTAYPYHGGRSESVVGQALQDGYRHRVRLATKLPCWLIEEASDLDRVFDEQLRRLGTESVDFYLLHGLNRERWNRMTAVKAISWAERQIAQGRIGHLGFSFHDRLDLFLEILDAYDGWTFCQIQYNYMDIDHQAGAAGLRAAADRGLGIVIMEPLRGGQLAKLPPPDVQPAWQTLSEQRRPADWALRWLWDQPEVSLVLSGMSNLLQVQQNLETAATSSPGGLRPSDRQAFDRIRRAYRLLAPVPCTSCGYCLPCPTDVAIPRIFEMFNAAIMYDDPDRARRHYHLLPASRRGEACIGCRLCESRCPQQIEVSRWIEKADRMLG